MLTLRVAHLQRFAAEAQRRFLARMCQHARAHFPARASEHPREELEARIAATIARARGYGLRSEQEHCRFLNLALTYGWSFDDAPATAWMRGFLTDPEVSSPAQRLALLVGECLHRAEVAESNRRIREAYAAPFVAPTRVADATEPAPVLDAASPDALVQNPRRGAARGADAITEPAGLAPAPGPACFDPLLVRRRAAVAR